MIKTDDQVIAVEIEEEEQPVELCLNELQMVGGGYIGGLTF